MKVSLVCAVFLFAYCLYPPADKGRRALIQFSSVNHVQLFATPWTAARQASLSITNSQSLLKLNVHRVGDAI